MRVIHLETITCYFFFFFFNTNESQTISGTSSGGTGADVYQAELLNRLAITDSLMAEETPGGVLNGRFHLKYFERKLRTHTAVMMCLSTIAQQANYHL